MRLSQKSKITVMIFLCRFVSICVALRLLIVPIAMLYFSIDETNIFNSMWLFTPFHFPPRGKGFIPSPLRKIVVKLRLLFS
jgi:hypothetical protein